MKLQNLPIENLENIEAWASGLLNEVQLAKRTAGLVSTRPAARKGKVSLTVNHEQQRLKVIRKQQERYAASLKK